MANAAAELHALLDGGLSLGGRTWLPIRSPTFELQAMRTAVVRRAGIAELFPRFSVDAGDSDALASDVIDTAFSNGALFDMLAHLLVEKGATWSRQSAAENALAFASLTEADDHARLSASVLWLVLDFFLSLANSTPIFLRSLLPRRANDENPRRSTRAQASSAEPMTSGAGITS